MNTGKIRTQETQEKYEHIDTWKIGTYEHLKGRNTWQVCTHEHLKFRNTGKAGTHDHRTSRNTGKVGKQWEQQNMVWKKNWRRIISCKGVPPPIVAKSTTNHGRGGALWVAKFYEHHKMFYEHPDVLWASKGFMSITFGLEYYFDLFFGKLIFPFKKYLKPSFLCSNHCCDVCIDLSNLSTLHFINIWKQQRIGKVALSWESIRNACQYSIRYLKNQLLSLWHC